MHELNLWLLKNAAGNAPEVEKALEQGADPDGAADAMNRTPLFHAAHAGNTHSVTLLLAAGADPDIADNDGETPLITALGKRNFVEADLIVKGGAGINMATGRQEQTLIHWAYNMDMRDGTTDRVLWLAERGANPLAKNGKGRDIYERAWDDEVSRSFGIEIAQQIGKYLRGKEEAAETAKQAAMQEDIRSAAHGGLKEDIAVRVLKLKSGGMKP